MRINSTLRTAIAAAVLISGTAARAGTVTFNGWQYDNGNVVNVSIATPLASFGGQAGAFKVTLSGFSGAFDGAFEAYCVELTQYINLPGGPYDDYRIVTAATYFNAKPGVADKLTNLVSYANNTNLLMNAGSSKDDQSTALQLAVWNSVYDTDTTLAWAQTAVLSDDTAFGVNGGSNFQDANDLLTNAGSHTGYTLYVLESDSRQDQLIWLRNSVPEPTSLALVALALGGAGFASRRRS